MALMLKQSDRLCLSCKNPEGFSLIELLITLAIIGILTAISVPLFSQHFIRENRLEAAGILSTLALAMEQYHIEHSSYQDATLNILHFPEFIVRNTYRLMIQSVTDDDYLLAVMPLGDQAKADQTCATLTLNSNGEKGITGQGHVETCW